LVIDNLQQQLIVVRLAQRCRIESQFEIYSNKNKRNSRKRRLGADGVNMPPWARSVGLKSEATLQSA
jgi:hypothetical protein